MARYKISRMRKCPPNYIIHEVILYINKNKIMKELSMVFSGFAKMLPLAMASTFIVVISIASEHSKSVYVENYTRVQLNEMGHEVAKNKVGEDLEVIIFWCRY